MCFNRFSQLADSVDECVAGVPEGSEVSVSVVSERMSGQGKKDRRLRVATWNFSSLCSECKQREVGQRLKIDVVAGQESSEREGRQLLLMAIDGL